MTSRHETYSPDDILFQDYKKVYHLPEKCLWVHIHYLIEASNYTEVCSAINNLMNAIKKKRCSLQRKCKDYRTKRGEAKARELIDNIDAFYSDLNEVREKICEKCQQEEEGMGTGTTHHPPNIKNRNLYIKISVTVFQKL